ncbi:MAG: histidine phosphatase family protein [Phycisphaerales bacterium]
MMRNRLMKRSGMAALASVIVVMAGCDSKAPPAPTPTRSIAPVKRPAAPVVEEVPIMIEAFADDADLIRSLRKGGYVLALRHAQTDMTQKDEQGNNFEDCAKQRQLSQSGRENARKIGEWFKQIGIPVGAVLTSPFCRNKETAQRAFGRFTIDNAVMGQDDDSVGQRRALLSTAPEAGKNTVVISHQKEMTKTTGLDLNEFGEGGALVLTPSGGPGGGFQVVHVIGYDDWERLAKASAEVK